MAQEEKRRTEAERLYSKLERDEELGEGDIPNLLSALEEHSHELRRRQARIEELRSTLQWYADEDRYEKRSRAYPPVLGDGGDRARRALEEDG